MSKKYRQLSSRVARERSKKYGGKLEAVGDLLYRFDPIGLVPFGVPADEYDGEAEAILERLPDCRSTDDVQTMVHRVFVERFDRAIAVEPRW